MVDPIAKVGPRVKPPTAYDISRKYLDMECPDYHSYIEDHFATWKEYGCTLMCDGWTNNNKHCTDNFMVYCVIGIVFLKSYATSGFI